MPGIIIGEQIVLVEIRFKDRLKKALSGHVAVILIRIDDLRACLHDRARDLVESVHCQQIPVFEDRHVISGCFPGSSVKLGGGAFRLPQAAVADPVILIFGQGVPGHIGQAAVRHNQLQIAICLAQNGNNRLLQLFPVRLANRHKDAEHGGPGGPAHTKRGKDLCRFFPFFDPVIAGPLGEDLRRGRFYIPVPARPSETPQSGHAAADVFISCLTCGAQQISNHIPDCQYFTPIPESGPVPGRARGTVRSSGNPRPE